MSTVVPYVEVSAFPNHVQSIEVTTGGLQSRNIKDDQRKQDAPELNFESQSKGLNTYVNKNVCFYLYICKNI
jgi:hypothetical protein